MLTSHPGNRRHKAMHHHPTAAASALLPTPPPSSLTRSLSSLTSSSCSSSTLSLLAHTPPTPPTPPQNPPRAAAPAALQQPQPPPSPPLLALARSLAHALDATERALARRDADSARLAAALAALQRRVARVEARSGRRRRGRVRATGWRVRRRLPAARDDDDDDDGWKRKRRRRGDGGDWGREEVEEVEEVEDAGGKRVRGGEGWEDDDDDDADGAGRKRVRTTTGVTVDAYDDVKLEEGEDAPEASYAPGGELPLAGAVVDDENDDGEAWDAALRHRWPAYVRGRSLAADARLGAWAGRFVADAGVSSSLSSSASSLAPRIPAELREGYLADAEALFGAMMDAVYEDVGEGEGFSGDDVDGAEGDFGHEGCVGGGDGGRRSSDEDDDDGDEEEEEDEEDERGGAGFEVDLDGQVVRFSSSAEQEDSQGDGGARVTGDREPAKSTTAATGKPTTVADEDDDDDGAAAAAVLPPTTAAAATATIPTTSDPDDLIGWPDVVRTRWPHFVQSRAGRNELRSAVAAMKQRHGLSRAAVTARGRTALGIPRRLCGEFVELVARRCGRAVGEPPEGEGDGGAEGAGAVAGAVDGAVGMGRGVVEKKEEGVVEEQKKAAADEESGGGGGSDGHDDDTRRAEAPVAGGGEAASTAASSVAEDDDDADDAAATPEAWTTLVRSRWPEQWPSSRFRLRVSTAMRKFSQRHGIQERVTNGVTRRAVLAVPARLREAFLAEVAATFGVAGTKGWRGGEEAVAEKGEGESVEDGGEDEAVGEEEVEEQEVEKHEEEEQDEDEQEEGDEDEDEADDVAGDPAGFHEGATRAGAANTGGEAAATAASSDAECGLVAWTALVRSRWPQRWACAKFRPRVCGVAWRFCLRHGLEERVTDGETGRAVLAVPARLREAFVADLATRCGMARMEDRGVSRRGEEANDAEGEEEEEEEEGNVDEARSPEARAQPGTQVGADAAKDSPSSIKKAAKVNKVAVASHPNNGDGIADRVEHAQADEVAQLDCEKDASAGANDGGSSTVPAQVRGGAAWTTLVSGRWRKPWAEDSGFRERAAAAADDFFERHGLSRSAAGRPRRRLTVTVPLHLRDAFLDAMEKRCGTVAWTTLVRAEWPQVWSDRAARERVAPAAYKFCHRHRLRKVGGAYAVPPRLHSAFLREMREPCEEVLEETSTEEDGAEADGDGDIPDGEVDEDGASSAGEEDGTNDSDEEEASGTESTDDGAEAMDVDGQGAEADLQEGNAKEEDADDEEDEEAVGHGDSSEGQTDAVPSVEIETAENRDKGDGCEDDDSEDTNAGEDSDEDDEADKLVAQNNVAHENSAAADETERSAGNGDSEVEGCDDSEEDEGSDEDGSAAQGSREAGVECEDNDEEANDEEESEAAACLHSAAEIAAESEDFEEQEEEDQEDEEEAEAGDSSDASSDKGSDLDEDLEEEDAAVNNSDVADDAAACEADQDATEAAYEAEDGVSDGEPEGSNGEEEYPNADDPGSDGAAGEQDQPEEEDLDAAHDNSDSDEPAGEDDDAAAAAAADALVGWKDVLRSRWPHTLDVAAAAHKKRLRRAMQAFSREHGLTALAISRVDGLAMRGIPGRLRGAFLQRCEARMGDVLGGAPAGGFAAKAVVEPGRMKRRWSGPREPSPIL